MRVRPRVLTAIAVAAVLALSACSGASSSGSAQDTGTPQSGGTLTWAVASATTAGGVDPMVATGLANQTIMDQAYETLLTRDADGEIQPGLATSWDQPDDTTFVFELREGVTFADGTPFTADDVVYTFETYQKATTSKKAYLDGLEKVEATGDLEVTFSFDSPNGTFLNAVAHRETFMIVGREGYGNATDDERETATFGTGPYQVTGWDEGVSITLDANPDYWGEDGPYVDTIDVSIIPDDSTRLAAVQQGSVDAASFSDATVAEQAEQAGDTMGDLSYTQSLPIFINPDSGALSDVRVRQAVSLALDRQALIDTAMLGNGKLSTIIPAGDPAAPEVTADTPLYTRDVAKAKELLAQAGQPNPTIHLSYFSDVSTAQIPIYELMQQQLAEAGITLVLDAKTVAQMSPIFTTGESFTDMVSLPWSYRADPTFYFDPFLSDSGAMNHWDNSSDADTAKQLLAQAKAAGDADEKAELVDELVQEVTEQVLVLVPMAVPASYELWNPDTVHGYSSDPYGSRYALTNTWVSR